MLTQTATTQKLSSTFANHSIDTHIVSAYDPHSYTLLVEAYDQLFRKFFPEEEYQEPLAKWLARIKEDNALSVDIVGISGKNLHDRTKRKLAGMYVGTYYRESQTGLLAYNIVDDEWRSCGLGRHQVELRKQALMDIATANNGSLRGLFCECNDPQIVPTTEDIIDPRRRLEIYARMGGMRVPMHYICPSGSDLGDKLGSMMLIAFPHPQTGQYPSKSDTIAHLKACYSVRGLNPIGDKDFDHMVSTIKERRVNRNNQWLAPLVDSNGRYVTPIATVS